MSELVDRSPAPPADMLIDRFLPRFDVTLIEHTVADATVAATWQALRELDLMQVHTPLMDAAANLNLRNVQLLLASGADRARQNTTGYTAYLLAKEQIEQIKRNEGTPPDYASEILDLVSPHNLAGHSTAAGSMK